ncbi:MAG: sugar phosphate isomerase/epimerase [Spirochaetes bacterium]|nr:sugar phosphate isomerase/epimerase [Spirochaetota bacterium]
MYFTGFADEAGKSIDAQIRATKELGWKFIESRAIDGVNMTDISDEKFEEVYAKLTAAGVSVNCFGSAVANWAKDPRNDEDFLKSIQELKRAFPRMKRLGTKMIRAMSFRIPDGIYPYPADVEKEMFRKVRYLVSMCEDAGVLYLHENCMNYGGLSAQHTLKLVEAVDSKAFGLIFDTGNPIHSYDRSGKPPYTKTQSSWGFYSKVKKHIRYVHIKDGRIKERPANEFYAKADYTYPGEGEGDVKRIVTDLVTNGYNGGFSIEPHMAVVFHDAAVSSEEDEKARIYVEYGRRFMKIVADAADSVRQKNKKTSVRPKTAKKKR